MFKRILVPLDGSSLAEQAIPLAARLAHATGASVLLLRVVDPLNTCGAYSPGAAVFLPEILEKNRVRAATYLARMAESAELADVQTHTVVCGGQPASQILDVAQEQHMDLIVLCSHGYTGFKRWALGSVAQKVVRQSTVPVLLLREQNLKLKSKMAPPLRALVALDGSPFAEAALLPIAELVAALSTHGKGELHLMQLVKVPTIEEEFGYLLDAKFNFRQTALQTAGSYLQIVRTNLLQKLPAPVDIQITWSVEECKDVADALIQSAESGKGIGTHRTSDLIALTTHGRGGLHRWISGSVTERVFQGSTLPLLIVHPQGVTASLCGEKETASPQTLAEKESSSREQKEDEHVPTPSSSS